MTLTRLTDTQIGYRHRITVQDLTGSQADVLWTLGDARTRGVLVKAEQAQEHPNGTVSVRVHHTDVIPLGLPKLHPSTPDTWTHHDASDYIGYALMIAPWAIGLGIAYVGYRMLTAVLDFLGVHGHAIATGVGSVAAVVVCVLLLMAMGGRGHRCVGLHCGGCKG